MNRLDFYLENDPREKALRDALYRDETTRCPHEDRPGAHPARIGRTQGRAVPYITRSTFPISCRTCASTCATVTGLAGHDSGGTCDSRRSMRVPSALYSFS